MSESESEDIDRPAATITRGIVQGAAAVRAAAAAVRRQPSSPRTALAREQAFIDNWAHEHASLGTDPDWDEATQPAHVAHAFESCAVPGGPFFGGLVLTFRDARDAIRAADESVEDPSPIEVRDAIAELAAAHAGREPPQLRAGMSVHSIMAAFVSASVASEAIAAAFGPIVTTVSHIDDALAVAGIRAPSGADVGARTALLDSWCRLRVPATVPAPTSSIADAVADLQAVRVSLPPAAAECFGTNVLPERLSVIATTLGVDADPASVETALSRVPAAKRAFVAALEEPDIARSKRPRTLR